jgi:iron complex outermembrane recepter protein
VLGIPVFLACCQVVAPSICAAQVPQAISAADLRAFSLEDLTNVVVTSVSKSEEALSNAAAAITVLTNTDIVRSGATTIPDLLRLVPGMHVAQRSSSTWAVSARGFSSISSEKMLVLNDTRSLYTPFFAGVFWDMQDVLLDDLERIEVIRGPGGALWGANAVNGVINITSKHARDTQGAFVRTHAGNEERFTVAARYGGRVGGNGHYRVFAKYAAHDDSLRPAALEDDWTVGHVGARADWTLNTANSLTVQGDGFTTRAGLTSPSIIVGGRPTPAPPWRVDSGGGNILARWTRRVTGSEMQARVYYDRTHRDDPSFVDDLHTFDADVQHRTIWSNAQELTFGANYRFTSSNVVGTGVLALDPPLSEDDVVSGFVQYQLRPFDALQLTVGTKVEHNDFSGGEVQPNVRAAWNSGRRQTIWGAVSRAVRVPTRFDRDLDIQVTPALRLFGNKAFEAEELLAYEAGYRWQPTDRVFLDLAAFHNDYSGLASLEILPVTTINGRTFRPISSRNLNEGEADGFEAQVTLTPVPQWRLVVGSSALWMDLRTSGADVNRDVLRERATPRHQFSVRSLLDLRANLQLDGHLRQSSGIELPITSGTEAIDGYVEADVRLAWRYSPQLELAVTGQNLLHDSHVEFGTSGRRGAIERGAYASLTWRR